jgi:DNA topoisomerase-1
MFKYLFIIESPGKKKKIQSFLGSQYQVIPTYGHIMDLHPKKISVDIKKDFKPTYEVNSDKKEVVKKIKAAAAKAEIVYIATDLDREGAYIAK